MLDFLRHRQEGRDAAAAGEAEDLLGVAKRLDIEVAEGQMGRIDLPFFDVGVEVIGDEAVFFAVAHRDGDMRMLF